MNNTVKHQQGPGSNARARPRIDDYLLHTAKVHKENDLAVLVDATKEVAPAVAEKWRQRKHIGKPDIIAMV
jgi:hypothetical protein